MTDSRIDVRDLRVFEGAHGEVTLTRDPEPRAPQTLREQVAEFHRAMGVEGRQTPGVPSDDVVRLRLRLIAEEFFELLESCCTADSNTFHGLRTAKHAIACVVESATLSVNLPEFADACADSKYVLTGAEDAFGIDGDAVMAVVHKSNMAKLGGNVRADGKIQKPGGWLPPDIAGELRKQGWNP